MENNKSFREKYFLFYNDNLEYVINNVVWKENTSRYWVLWKILYIFISENTEALQENIYS